MSLRPVILVLGVLLVAGGAIPARSQSVPPASPPRSTSPADGSPAARSERLRIVRDVQMLIRQGKYEDALARLKEVPADETGGDDVVMLRGLCLRKLGRFDEVATLFRGQADAIAARGGDPIPILIELERAYRESKDPERAFGVCLEIHRTNAAANPWILDEIESLVHADSLSGRVVTALQKEIESRPDAQDLRDMIVGAYVFLGRTGDALREARDLDRARGAHGRLLLEHVRLLARKEMGQPVVEAADLALAEGLKGDDAQEALLMRADGLRRAKRFTEAAEAYAKAAAERPEGPLARLAFRNRAEMTVQDLHDVAAGAVAYADLVKSLENAPVKDRGRLMGQALVALSDCQLRLGRYEESAETLKRIEKEAPDATSREEAAYQQAEIFFYSGQADTAQAAYRRVVSGFSGGNRVNDALDRILMLSRCEQAGTVPMAALGQIAYQTRVGSPTRALEICETARRECGTCPAQEDILKEQTGLLIALGKIDEAAATADTAAVLFPVGATSPALLRAVADAMRARDGDTERVIRRYEDLVVRYPKSQEAMETRTLLEKLRRTGELEGDRRRERRG
jgi:tetratricopeptide (TPR) repeat protein